MTEDRSHLAGDLRRAVTVLLMLVRTTARAVASRLRPGDRRPWTDVVAVAVADSFEDLGPTFVKLGQLITSSPGVFPAPLVEACRRHLYSVRPVPASAVRAVIAEDLGAPVVELFGSFDDQPLSAASIAQVHACTLLDGQPAVVKVQRPDITTSMLADLRVLGHLARLIDRIPAARGTNLPGIVADLHHVTIQELDFTHEAEVQSRFAEGLHAFGDNAMVTVPRVFPGLCGGRTITMERLSGTPLDRYAAEGQRAEEGETVLRRILKVWLEAVIVHGPFHGDVHGGNIWVLDDGRVAFLDFGISGELEPGWRQFLAKLFLGTAFDGGFAPLARSAKLLGAIPETAGTDEEVGDRLAVLITPFLGGGAAEVSLGEVLRSLVTAFDQFGTKVPNELILVAKQLLYLEGYTKALAPDHRLAADTYLLRNIHPDLVNKTRMASAHPD